MKGKLRLSPSPALVISILALVLAASGTAIAASKLVSGNSIIKVNSLSGNRLKSGSVTGKQIALSSLGTVPSATNATSAATATTATTANTATTAGSAPIANVIYETQSGTILSNIDPNTGEDLTPDLLTVSCPAGTTVIGGGASVQSESEGIVNDSYPSGKTGWRADFFTTEPQQGTVMAICAPAAATTGT